MMSYESEIAHPLGEIDYRARYATASAQLGIGANAGAVASAADVPVLLNALHRVLLLAESGPATPEQIQAAIAAGLAAL
jgi:hypothetical protein